MATMRERGMFQSAPIFVLTQFPWESALRFSRENRFALFLKLL
jgi:hypothetical protein